MCDCMKKKEAKAKKTAMKAAEAEKKKKSVKKGI